MKNTAQLSEDWIVCLSSNSYFINIIEKDQIIYRIDCEEPIVYFNPLNLAHSQNANNQNLKQINKKINNQVRHLIVFNRKLQWVIYELKKQNQPKGIFYGNLPFDKSYSGSVQIINVHQVNAKIVIIMADFQVFQLIIIQKMKLSKTKQPKYINIKYLNDQQKSPFLALKYLPSLQTNNIIDSLYTLKGNKRGMFYLVFEQKFTQMQKKLWSVFVIQIDLQNYQFLTGKQCILNISSKVIFLSTIGDNAVVIQTEQQILYWKDSQSQQNGNSYKQSFQRQQREWKLKRYNEHSFPFALTTNYNQKQLIGISQTQKEHAIIKIYQKQSELIFQKLSQIKNEDKMHINILQCFLNYSCLNDSYILSQTFQIYKLANLREPILVNHSSTILYAKVTSDPNFNILMVIKKIGIKQEKIIMTNQQFCKNATSYQHNLMISLAQCVFIQTNSDRKDAHLTMVLTSPIIGSLPLKYSVQKNDNFSISLNQFYQGFSKSQILAMSQQVIITQNQISLIKKEQKKAKIIQKKKISTLFKDSIDFIHRAVIFSKDLIVLGVDDQLHIFDGSFKLKFIYVFEGEIKKLLKLNTVNVIGVELYQTQDDEPNSQSQFEKNVFSPKSAKLQILIIGQDKIKLVQQVKFISMAKYKWIQFQTTINTVAYQITFVGNKMILCSSQEMHKYQTDKIKILTDDIPLPLLKQSNVDSDNIEEVEVQVVLFYDFGQQKSQNNFMLIFHSAQDKSVRIFVGSISKKYLVKSNEELSVSYEEILTNVQLKKQKFVFGAYYNSRGNMSCKQQSMIVLTQKKMFNLELCSGKVSQSMINPKIMERLVIQYRLQQNKSLVDSLKGLQNIAKPVKLCFCSSKSEQKLILHNSTQVWYASIDKQQQRLNILSVYTLINDAFMQFRNNLSVDQLNEKNFIKLFSEKLPIIQVKFLNKKSIIVLYQKSIIILEVGYNDALNVRQEIKFSKNQNPNQNQLANLSQPDNQNNANNYTEIGIVELLDVVNDDFIYMKDSQSRLYLLKINFQKQYQIVFDRNLQDDIMCIGRVKSWNDKSRVICLLNSKKLALVQSTVEQEITVKKDGQFLIRNISNDKKHQTQKAVYI